MLGTKASVALYDVLAVIACIVDAVFEVFCCGFLCECLVVTAWELFCMRGSDDMMDFVQWHDRCLCTLVFLSLVVGLDPLDVKCDFSQHVTILDF